MSHTINILTNGQKKRRRKDMSYTINILEKIFVAAGEEKLAADEQVKIDLKRLDSSEERLKLAIENELEAQSALTRVRRLDNDDKTD